MKGIKAGVLTASDRAAQGVYADQSGRRLCALFERLRDCQVVRYEVVPDDREIVAARLKSWCDLDQLDVVLTTGGTGLGPRDITPEATRSILDKEVPGLAELLRVEGSRSTPMAWLSRAVAGIRGQTLVVNLPGNPEAVVQGFQIIEPLLLHALAMIHGEPHPHVRGSVPDQHHALR